MKCSSRRDRYLLPAGRVRGARGRPTGGEVGPGTRGRPAAGPDPGVAGKGERFMTGQEVLAPATETDSLRQQLLQAQRLSSVGELASSIAHEFNNILTTIINSAKLGMRNPDLGEKQQAFDRIVKAGQRAANIASGMLWFARKSSTHR